MKKHCRWIAIVALSVLAACSTTANVTYQPISTPSYTEKLGPRISIRSVTDERTLPPNEYWMNPRVPLDTAKYSRPVASIVQEALQTEFQRAGTPPETETGTRSGSAHDTLALDCRVVDFKAVFTPSTKLFGSNAIEMIVALRFRWLDPKNGQLVEENERAERRHRDVGLGTPTLPFEASQIEDYGTQLVNELLPAVIAKEIQLNKRLREEG